MGKEQETYRMVYVCLNCGYKLYKDIPYGEAAPRIGRFSKDFPEETCSYCGYTYFSNPFRPDDPRVKQP